MTISGILLGLFTGVVCGGFCGVCIIGIFETLFEIKSKIKRWVFRILIIILTGIISFLIASIGFSNQEKTFNNGYCPHCNIKYEAIEYSHGETYYECPNCRVGVWW